MQTRTRNLCVVFVALTVVVVTVFAISASKTRHRASVESSFRNVSLAIQNYVSAFGELPQPVYWNDEIPPKAMHSWRLHVSAFLEMQGYESPVYSVPWDDPSNSRLRTMPIAFVVASNRSQNHTSVFAITGPDTAFGDGQKHAPTVWDNIPNDTIIAMEVVDSGRHWMSPGDYEVDGIADRALDEAGRFKSGAIRGRFHVIFADAEVWALSTDTAYGDLAPFFQISSANTNDRNALLSKYCVAKF